MTTTFGKLYELAGMLYEKNMVSKDDFQYLVDTVRDASREVDEARKERPVAHWIRDEMAGGNHSLQCDRCGNIFLERHMGPEAKFCACCGARIEKEKKDDRLE